MDYFTSKDNTISSKSCAKIDDLCRFFHTLSKSLLFYYSLDRAACVCGSFAQRVFPCHCMTEKSRKFLLAALARNKGNKRKRIAGC